MISSKTLRLSTSKLVDSKNKLQQDQNNLEAFHDELRCECGNMDSLTFQLYAEGLSPRFNNLLMRANDNDIRAVQAEVSSEMDASLYKRKTIEEEMFESVPLTGRKRRMFDGTDLLKKYWSKLRHAKIEDYTEKTPIYEEAPDEISPPFEPEGPPGKKKNRLSKRLNKLYPGNEEKVAHLTEQWMEKKQNAKLEKRNAKTVCCQEEATEEASSSKAVSSIRRI